MSGPFNLADYYLFDRLDEGLAEAPALLFGERRQSYAEVAADVRALSAYLIAAGVAAEQRVLLALPDTPAYAAAFFATLRIGAVVAMGNPHAPTGDLDYLVRYTGARAVVTTVDVAGALAPTLAECGCLVIQVEDVATGEDWRARRADASPAVWLADALEGGRRLEERGAPTRRETEADHPAIWLFTSGSTGRSKAAMHCHRDFAFNTERYAISTVGYRHGDITVSVPRLFFGYATGTNLMFPFRVGATAALFSERPTPETLARAIERYRPTIVTNVPTMMGKLLEDDDARTARKEPRLDLSSVRFHLSAGEALPPALLARFLERFGGEVYDGIGSAEMFHIYCSNRPGDVMPGSLGRVVDGYELRILAADAEGPGAPTLPAGETGVMWVKGDSVALGYYGDRDKSWETFHGHWCRTGDLFRIDERGYLWFEGRADDLLKVGGIWVAPLEVENCLAEHPVVAAVAVIGVELEGLVKPKAFVVPKSQEEATESLADALKHWVQTRLSKHKYPRLVAFVDELPKNDRGKIDRKELRRRELAGQNPVGR
ncbi:MAG: benzoate-CoA ligase family protein [Deltaproteobacteria bacterium]|nr:benzoate-CoA ligase family protein [Deltaproteobacteria bacterium]